MSEATLQALRDAGANIDVLDPAQRDVFASLTPEDLAVVTSIQTRLNAAESAVTGQMADTNNNLC